MDWLPSASLGALEQAAKLRYTVHQWMHKQQLLEVITPTASLWGVTDPYVQSVMLQNGGYLHTSPEYAMKRLLAAHSMEIKPTGILKQPDIYQIARVFREEEIGRYHQREFTLLEWYRVGWNHHQLANDVEQLLRYIFEQFEIPWPGMQQISYGESVKNLLHEWPENLSVDQIKDYFLQHQRSYPDSLGNDHTGALNLLMDEFVLPGLDPKTFTLISDYPANQASLARVGVDNNQRSVAERFEIYYGKVELANGFHELNDPIEQRQRFEQDNVLRVNNHQAPMPIDEPFLTALQSGLPDCAGVAVGLERLHMVLGNHTHIKDVVSFHV